MLGLTLLHVHLVFGSSPLERPQIFWQGKLEGTHDLVIRKTSLVVVDVSGPPVADQVYRFTEALPADSVVTDVDPRSSRGYVRILEQPAMDNDYSLRIRIEDRQVGPFLYGIAITWNPDSVIMSTADLRRPRKAVLARDAAWNQAGHPAKVTCRAVWQGDLRGNSRLSISAREAVTISGKAKGNLNVRSDTSWPKGIYYPVVLATSKETQAKIVDPPTRENGYTLIVDVTGDTLQAAIEIAW